MTHDLTHLSTVLGSDRFNTYLKAAADDLDAAFALYQWNIAAAAAWWGPLHVYEVALRNAIHARLTALAGQPEWWHHAPTRVLLSTRDQKVVESTAAAVVRRYKESATPGHVVAELTLGFWTGLCAARYHQSLWVATLHEAFPGWIGERRDLHPDLQYLNRFRNRVAHHEPIFLRDQSRSSVTVVDRWIHRPGRGRLD